MNRSLTRDKIPDMRQQSLYSWLDSLGISNYQLTPLAGDASFRRYFRLHLPHQTQVVMDAPPEKENCQPFVTIAQLLYQASLTVPELLAINIEQGFLLLSDFGDQQLLLALNHQTADHYYSLALHDLIPLQKCTPLHLPNFDQAFMHQELQPFLTWYLQEYRHISLTTQQQQLLHQTYQLLIQSAEQQPQVLIHRDYHSRNLMVLNQQQLGILDFQDAMRGPIAYDVVSLLHDCYIVWPRAKVIQWVQQYVELAQQQDLLPKINQQQFLQWFDWMGLQRHIKVLGVFARLFLRDEKPYYLQDIPRIVEYILNVSAIYPQLSDFNQLMRQLCLSP